MNIILWRIKYRFQDIIWFLFQSLRKCYYRLSTGGKDAWVCYDEWLERAIKPEDIKLENGSIPLYLKCPKCEKITIYDNLINEYKEHLTCMHCEYRTEWRFSSDFNSIMLDVLTR